MAINERVSQLTNLPASEIAAGDIFLVTDMSQRESKKLEVGQLLLFIESSGSFNAVNSVYSDSASYVSAGDVDGIVAIATISSQSISASWAATANTSISSSIASTSSYSTWCNTTTINADTASYLEYLGTFNGTASYALVSDTSNTSAASQFLIYTGGNNGTASHAMRAISASYAISASQAISASSVVSSSHALISNTALVTNTTISASIAQTASYISSVTYGPKFITPVIVRNTTAAVAFTTFSASAYIPPTATVVILDGYLLDYDVSAPGQILIRSDTSGQSYILATGYCGPSAVSGCGGQGMFPMNSFQSFQYSFTDAPVVDATLRLIGYF